MTKLNSIGLDVEKSKVLAEKLNGLYPGAGETICQGLVYGHIVAEHAAGSTPAAV